MAQPIIEVNHLTKKYQIGEAQADTLAGALRNLLRLKKSASTFLALNDVSFTLDRGEVLGVIGRNGAGKSTLLKVLSRITEPSSGHVNVYGRVASLLEVGTGFHPDLTGRENVYLNGTILGMKRAEISRKFDEIVAFAGVEKFIDTAVKHYSSGMYVRLAFAVAAHLEPEVLIIDEVLAVGDAEFQKKCLGKMQQVSREDGRTVLFVSHQLGMVRSLCTRGILLRQGQLVAQGEIGGVISHYLAEGSESEQLPEVKLVIDETLEAQLLSLDLVNEGGIPTTSFDVFDTIRIKYQYIIRKPQSGIGLTCTVERNGDLLFVSFDTDNNPERLGRRDGGLYRGELNLPTPLKAGLYNISFNIGRPNVGGIHINKNILRFVVEERSFDPSLKAWSANRPGHLVASLNWIEERV